MPTGGVTVENAADWIRAGAVAVGVGSALTDAAAIAARDYASIASKARRLVEDVANAKGGQR
jgi:2-dehydro-3-deoxyphosphogluconate aldolase/(4S)-4-hydroxy-2-oxoglutarate aldolase